MKLKIWVDKKFFAALLGLSLGLFLNLVMIGTLIMGVLNGGSVVIVSPFDEFLPEVFILSFLLFFQFFSFKSYVDLYTGVKKVE